MTPARVLVADDDLAIRELIRIRLRQNGLEVLEAADGQEAIDRIKADRPDLIVLDLKMPRLTGYEVMEQVQADPECRRIPVIIITAHGSLPPTDNRLDNMAAYVIKPFSPKALAEMVLRVLSSPKGSAKGSE